MEVTALYQLAQVILQEKRAVANFPKELLNVTYKIDLDQSWVTNLYNVLFDYEEIVGDIDINGRRLDAKKNSFTFSNFISITCSFKICNGALK